MVDPHPECDADWIFVPSRIFSAIVACGLLAVLVSCGLENPTFEPTKGSVYVVSHPDSADIICNGILTGLFTPDTLTLLSPGDHTIQVEMADFAATQDSMIAVVSAGETFLAEFTLMKTIGNLTITSTPGDASIFIDGADSGELTPATLTGLSLGEHVVHVILAGYSADPESLTVEILPDDSAAAEFTLTEIPGSLAVISTPSGAAIFVDGMDSGRFTPGTLSGLAVGNHVVSVTMEGYTVTPESMSVVILPDEITQAEFTLTEITGSLDVTSTPAGATIIVDYIDTGELTPTILTGLSPGDHVVEVAMAGYIPDPEFLNVAILADETASADFSLTPAGDSSTKIVLLEGFSNVCCAGCPEMNQALHELMSMEGYGTDKVLLVKFSVPFPFLYDPHYLANTADNDARAWGPNYDFTGYYADLFTSVPTLFGDGALLGGSGNPPTTAELIPLVDALLNEEPGFGIQVEAAVMGTSVSTTVTLSAAEDVDLSGMTLNVVLVENPIEYAEAPCDGGDELVFHWIMRDFQTVTTSLPQLTGGTPLVETTTLTGNLSWPADHLFVIAFVQNDATRKVLQAGSNVPVALPADSYIRASSGSRSSTPDPTGGESP